jgi:hypothetical protein
LVKGSPVADNATDNPLRKLLDDAALSRCDFGVLEHGFVPHGRDYRFLIQDSLCIEPGTYELLFTHVVELKYETRVVARVWQSSWTDEFTNYATWQAAGEPEGYVFGTDWSLAYPGVTIPDSSPVARDWSERLQHPIYSAVVETDLFCILLLFSGVRHRKISDQTDVVRLVVTPLSPQN